MLLHNPRGGYRFLPGGDPYSSGVTADDGLHIVHVTLAAALPYREGLARAREYIRSQGREITALCAVELRSPVPFTRSGFTGFNQGYRQLLEEWGILVDGQNPVARTNVVPEWEPPSEPSLYAFSYTSPAASPGYRSFVVAGAGEMRGGDSVIRAGETSPDAMREKAAYVARVMEKRLQGLWAGWEDVTAVNLYTRQAMDQVLPEAVIPVLGPAVRRGICWFRSRPPIDELEFEMDVRGVREERTEEL